MPADPYHTAKWGTQVLRFYLTFCFTVSTLNRQCNNTKPGFSNVLNMSFTSENVLIVIRLLCTKNEVVH